MHARTESKSRTTGRGPALALAASGLLFLVGAILHPHAPQARDMSEVAYTQTGQVAWWPAHLLLLASYVLFAGFLTSVARGLGPQSPPLGALNFVLPVAYFGVLAMLIHLLLPLGRESVANSHVGWALWAKDFVEAADGLWALGVAVTAWELGRARIVGNTGIGLVGVAGGVGFAVFSIFVPLTGVVVSMEFTRSLLQFVPVTGVLIAGWALISGITAVFPSAGRTLRSRSAA